MDPEIEGTSAAEDPEIKVPQWTSSPGSIFRAPAHIRYGRESDFEPKLVSIGPYHHGRENLRPMEVTKTKSATLLCWRRTFENFVINKNPDHTLKKNKDPDHDISFYGSFRKFEKDARGFYKEKFDHISDKDFVKMLVTDSCFIIRVILSFSQEVQESMAFLDVNMKEVRSDLLLLENQIPLFFIREVYKKLFTNLDTVKVPDFDVVLASFICLDLPWKLNDDKDKLLRSSAHLLDFYWRSSVTDNTFHKRAQNNHSAAAPKFIANATELHQMAGIKFEKLNSIGLQGKFFKGILSMPYLRIDSSHTTLFINLIAHENPMLPFCRIISTYIKFMDDLIDSEKDVELLQKSGVIYNTLSNHSKAATYFNDTGNICSIDSDNNRFSQLFEDVEKYYKSIGNRRWASLQQNYFSSPWAGISVFAGVTLLILTVLQTFYTIYGYYNPMH